MTSSTAVRYRPRFTMTFQIILFFFLSTYFQFRCIYFFKKNQSESIENRNHHLIPNKEEYDLDKIPSFMRDYFDWHKEKLQQLEKDRANASDEEGDAYLHKYKFLVHRCITGPMCEGVSDRTASFPLFILYAALSDRILLFYWEDPAPIETFMLPVSFNWTVPDDVYRRMKKMDFGCTYLEIEGFSRSSYRSQNIEEIDLQTAWLVEGEKVTSTFLYRKVLRQVVNSTLSTIDPVIREAHPNRFANIKPSDTDYREFYHDLFHATFRPSPGVQAELDNYFHDPFNAVKTVVPTQYRLPVPLKRNEYVVAHYRSKYPKQYPGQGEDTLPANQEFLLERTTYAVECAKSRLPNESSVLFMSDSLATRKMAHDMYHADATTKATSVQTSLSLSDGNGHTYEEREPTHISLYQSQDVSQFYNIFVDIFVMSYAKCVVYGAGGFGLWGSYLSNNAKCGLRWQKGYVDPTLVECPAYNE